MKATILPFQCILNTISPFSQAYNFTIDLNELQSTLKANISMVQQYYQKFTDMWWSPHLILK